MRRRRTVFIIATGVILIGILASVFSVLRGRVRRVPLDVQLAGFQQIGIQPAATYDRDEMLNLFPLESLEEHPYEYLYSALGMSNELDPTVHFCDSIWSFDAESVAEETQYAAILGNIARISQGEIKVSDVSVDGGALSNSIYDAFSEVLVKRYTLSKNGRRQVIKEHE